MTETNVTVRGVKKEVYNQFKAEAVRRGLKVGEAVTQALQFWVQAQKEPTREMPLEEEPLWKLISNPADFGVETDASRVSEELYGYKTLTISKEAYKRLLRAKKSGESFTKVILRLTTGEGSLLKHAGAWGELDDSEVDRVFSEIEEAWRKGWRTG